VPFQPNGEVNKFFVLNAFHLDQRRHFTGIVRDISERKRAEEALRVSEIERNSKIEALRQNEERFRELMAHLHKVLWMIDAKGDRILYISPAYEKVWGRSCQSIIDNPHSYMESVHPLDVEMMRREIALMYQTGHIDVECRILRPEGAERWVWIRGYPVTEQGQIVRLVGVSEDITEKRRLAAEREALLSRLQLHIERMPLAYILFDGDFRIIDWNPTAERIFGYAREEMLGKGPPYEQFVPRSFWEKAEEILNRIRSGDMKAHSVNENLTKDGRTIVCQWLNTPLMDENSQFVGLLGLAQDVTEQRSLEAQLHQSQKMEAFGQLAGGVAHDFNNLLTVISGFSELLLSQFPKDNPKRSFLEQIHRAGDRAASLTRQLLAFSRQQVLEPKVLNLNALVNDTEKMLRRLIGEDVQIVAVLSPTLHPVKVDPGQIEQVIMNLAVNARDAMPQGGKLTIETQNVELDEAYAKTHSEVRPGRFVLLAMTDTGSGMTPEVKARIFEPFFTTKGVGKGTGLGLAVVQGIVKQSSGSIDVYSDVGSGTTFKIYLPAVKERPTSLSNPGLSKLALGTETILLVEDEDAVRELTALALEGSGYTVLKESRGKDALRLMEGRTERIDLLVTDVVMPEMSGGKLAEALQSRYPGLKVLFLSGYMDDAVFRHGILRDKVAFLQKPFTVTSLTRKVRDVLDQK
jgi:two-component system cell cycle sensor histidine kinase/response regulator CckA